MELEQIGAGEFKARCLTLLDEVASSGKPLVITKRGKPVAHVVPVPGRKRLFGALAGSVLAQSRIVEPVDETWQAES